MGFGGIEQDVPCYPPGSFCKTDIKFTRTSFKGAQSADLDTSFVSFEKRLPQPEIFSSVLLDFNFNLLLETGF